MNAVDQHAEAHRLKTECQYSERRIAAELGVSRHVVRQLLARPLPQPVVDQQPLPVEPVAAVVDQRPPLVEPLAAAADQVRPVVEPSAEGLVVATALVGHATGAVRFPRPGVRSQWLRIDLSRRRGLLRDLMALARVGLQIPHVVDLAIRSFAAAYWEAVTNGHLQPGQGYEIHTRVRPCRHAA
ncbi:hypothetical protein [Streptomyces stelliscabiei]|uniref:hypothetical protein n=1 Tax=Streptomyces stelliscabiei TaxID=146820 RepID=UPI0029ADACDD|nr:hypothetical protein [Streptomyces stelliscabiei]MDX2667422.1 hypothetical protein [Streptomyces stelliscabiei]MDX2785961.1 hypothetical protein [Streptomyces stelliscabiei]